MATSSPFSSPTAPIDNLTSTSGVRSVVDVSCCFLSFAFNFLLLFIVIRFCFFIIVSFKGG